ncbi:hypothetical protein, partial [Klebsiella variicola]|uniref:hypothetical protein n=1 Tax=Klebsiella variicola TaxID=244366 RepID=UPI0039C3992A
RIRNFSSNQAFDSQHAAQDAHWAFFIKSSIQFGTNYTSCIHGVLLKILPSICNKLLKLWIGHY